MKPIVLLALLAASAMAGHWDIEQVDSAGWGDGLQMRRHPDGRLFLCYGDTSGMMRLASRDAAWHYEDVPAEFRFLRYSYPYPQRHAFDIDPSGKLGIAYQCSTGVRCIVETDSGWHEFAGYSLGSCPMPAYRPDGTFSYAVYSGSSSIINVWLDDTLWVPETIAHSSMGEILQYWTNRTLPDGRQVCSITADNQSLLMGGIFYCIRVGDSWASSEWSLAMHRWYWAAGCDADTADSIRLCYGTHAWDPPYAAFRYERSTIDGVEPTWSVLDIDTSNRPQIAYARPDLWYTYGDSSGWHNQEVDGRSVLALDMVLSESCQPIIAYANDSGVFLARGVDVAGQSEERQQPTAIGQELTASVIRNVLSLPEATSFKPQAASWLLDITGRKVLDLKPGPNDVQALAPGVYFVREEPQGTSVKPQAVQKVVITK